MQKKTYFGVQLSCVLHTQSSTANTLQPVINPLASTALDDGLCLTGVISRTRKGFHFEEASRKGRPPRNPKLYDGKYISMVRMQNGRYQCHLKTMDKGFVKNTFAEGVYEDIINALKIID